MRISQIPFLATSSLFLLSHVVCMSTCTGTDSQPFAELVASLDNLGYNDKEAASTLGALNHSTAANASSISSPCSKTCNFLNAIFPNITSQMGSPSYIHQEASYWSAQQSETQPECRIRPRSATDVSASLLITKFFSCPFAVKSGGHAMFAGASNIPGGLTIDLANLNQIQISQDRTLTHVGAGNRWIDVYSKLEEQQLAVIGGRVAGIGVGGLTLGGGISFFSGRHGWACDNVRSYELVLPNASTTTITPTNHPSLFFALRGGGNNFGIVTAFSLETFPQGPMWGGSLLYPLTSNTSTSLIRALINFAHAAPSDPDAALILNFVYLNSTFFISTDIEYAKPTINPPIFHPITSIPNTTSTMRIANLTDLTLELEHANPTGFRQTYITSTFKPSVALIQKILSIYIDEVSHINHVPHVLPAITLQPIGKNVISHFSKNGGNALGIAESDGPLILLNLSILWSLSTSDPLIHTTATNFINRCRRAAKRQGLEHRFIYQNYAAKGQDVFAGYGEANNERLRAVSKEYDPERVFQKLEPGYFKLDA